MKVCPECARTYSDEAVVCAFDGTPLSSGSTAAWEPTKSAEPEEGDVLGQYRIIDRIGRGGMGTIYRAEHVRLGRQVALKVLRSSLIKRTDAAQRFFTEAKAVNEIGHPNIVDIIDFVELVDHEPPLVYMVMELLEGENLGQRLRRDGPLSPDEVRAVALQIADALAATHGKNILHRDLKPENVFLVATPDGAPRIKLLDFGVAKAFGRRKGVNLTNPGLAVGTPEYMTPEQIQEQEVDARADIYALGVLLYEMLTGTVPFQGPSQADTLIMHVREPPPPLGQHRADLPPDLEAVVMTCLEKEPARRFGNADALRAALEAPAEPTLEQAAPPPRSRPRWPVLAVSAVLLLASAVVIWALAAIPDADPASGSGPDSAPAPSVESAADAGGRPDLAARADTSETVRDAAPARPDQRRRRVRVHRRRPHNKRTKKPGAKSGPGKKPGSTTREGTVDPFSL